MLIRPAHATGPHKLADGKPHFLDYREKAPASASADMYLDKERNVIKGMSMVGYKASGVPGTVAGFVYAEQHFGRLGLKAVMAPAIRLAREGFHPGEEELRTWKSKTLAQFPESHRIFQRDGNFYTAGETILQPDLAATLERIATNPDDFYHGTIAHQIADFMQAGGGLITADDLAHYEVKDRAPLTARYHGYDIVTAPPPSSGGIVLIEAGNILDG